MKRAEEAKGIFLSGYSCSQAVLNAFAKENGMTKKAALKLADAFGGGMGGMGKTCGAVTAAFMVIGLKYGRTKPKELAKKKKTRRLITLFSEKFKAKHGSLECSELLGCNMGTEKGKKKAAACGFFVKKCPEYVKFAVELLENL